MVSFVNVLNPVRKNIHRKRHLEIYEPSDKSKLYTTYTWLPWLHVSSHSWRSMSPSSSRPSRPQRGE